MQKKKRGRVTFITGVMKRKGQRFKDYWKNEVNYKIRP